MIDRFRHTVRKTCNCRQHELARVLWACGGDNGGCEDVMQLCVQLVEMKKHEVFLRSDHVSVVHAFI